SSRSSVSPCSSIALSASSRCNPSTQSSLSTPSSLPNVAMSPFCWRNWLTASSLINCCSAGDDPPVAIGNSLRYYTPLKDEKPPSTGTTMPVTKAEAGLTNQSSVLTK